MMPAALLSARLARPLRLAGGNALFGCVSGFVCGRLRPMSGGGFRGLKMEAWDTADFTSTDAIIELLKDNPLFQKVSKQETERTMARDAKDGEKLAKGISDAVGAGTLTALKVAPSYELIDVSKLNADERAEHIIRALPSEGGAVQGCVLVLVGNSGTGKGTTCGKIMERVPQASMWSNGNCFRALTMLAIRHCQAAGDGAFNTACLTPNNLEQWVNMLEFGKFNGKVFDIKISGLGVDELVSNIALTELRKPQISNNVPLVAEKAQAQVVKLCIQAVEKLASDGKVVLLEGRRETLDFIPSRFRFELVMPAEGLMLIGQRVASQRIMAVASKKAQAGESLAEGILRALDKVARQ